MGTIKQGYVYNGTIYDAQTLAKKFGIKKSSLYAEVRTGSRIGIVRKPMYMYVARNDGCIIGREYDAKILGKKLGYSTSHIFNCARDGKTTKDGITITREINYGN